MIYLALTTIREINHLYIKETGDSIGKYIYIHLYIALINLFRFRYTYWLNKIIKLESKNE